MRSFGYAVGVYFAIDAKLFSYAEMRGIELSKDLSTFAIIFQKMIVLFSLIS